MTIWHCHAAVSLDGKIARSDGSVDWLMDYPPDDALGFAAFTASVDAILMGRGTYEAVRQLGDWPHPDKPTVVLTNRPLRDAPPRVEARGGDLAPFVAEMERTGYRRVWVEGGGVVVRDMLAIGELDVLELAVIPIVLGDGIPLFPEGTVETKLVLDVAKPWTKSAVHLVYRRA
ncbi:MAG: dihydrofolate reductase family protein [Rhodospirillaceae bacterium]|nr:dihydrofolate reductase family protein [Rhodospirillaceae bacterium]